MNGMRPFVGTSRFYYFKKLYKKSAYFLCYFKTF